MVCKAVIFDYIGTLVEAKNYTMQDSTTKLYNSLIAEGFSLDKEKFLGSYACAHEKYRVVRYGQLREVTNAVWVSEALNNLGYSTKPNNAQIKAALNVFFKDFICSLQLRAGAKKLLKQASATQKCGLISNFTYAPVIYSSLRKLGINGFFNVIVVSEALGWRKPSKHIFREALTKLQVKPEEAVYVGDSPVEDIKGAMDAGIKTVFIQSQFNSLADLATSGFKPDFAFEKLEDLHRNFTKCNQLIRD
jgi:HAD superfamily hydrolase (TIGR01549 family)